MNKPIPFIIDNKGNKIPVREIKADPYKPGAIARWFKTFESSYQAVITTDFRLSFKEWHGISCQGMQSHYFMDALTKYPDLSPSEFLACYNKASAHQPLPASIELETLFQKARTSIDQDAQVEGMSYTLQTLAEISSDLFPEYLGNELIRQWQKLARLNKALRTQKAAYLSYPEYCVLRDLQETESAAGTLIRQLISLLHTKRHILHAPHIDHKDNQHLPDQDTSPEHQ